MHVNRNLHKCRCRGRPTAEFHLIKGTGSVMLHAVGSLQRKILRGGGVVVLTALMLVPLLFRGHAHASAHCGTSATCAVCVAIHFSPPLNGPVALHPAPALWSFTLVADSVTVPCKLYRSCSSGRAPPLSSTSHVV